MTGDAIDIALGMEAKIEDLKFERRKLKREVKRLRQFILEQFQCSEIGSMKTPDDYENARQLLLGK